MKLIRLTIADRLVEIANSDVEKVISALSRAAAGHSTELNSTSGRIHAAVIAPGTRSLHFNEENASADEPVLTDY